MIPDHGRPPDGGSAARLQNTREWPRSMIPSQVFVVILAATAMHAAVINDRFHKNNAKVAPSAQFLQDGTIEMGTNDGAHQNASELPGFTNRIGSAQTELVTRRGQSHRDAFTAEPFAASYFLTYSSSVASSLITWKSAVFDKRLVTSSSEISQNRIAGGDIETIEGGPRGLYTTRPSCRVYELPLLERFDE